MMKKSLLKKISIFLGSFVLLAIITLSQGMTVDANDQYNGSPYQGIDTFINTSGKMADGAIIDTNTVKVEVDYSKITPGTNVITKDMLKVTYWDSDIYNDNTYIVRETKDYRFRHNLLSTYLNWDIDYNTVDFQMDENYVYIYVGAYYNDTLGKYCAVEIPVKIKYSKVKFDLRGGVADPDYEQAFDDQVVIFDQKVVEPVVIPEKESESDGNYYFVGWNTKADGSGVYWNFNDKITESMTLYAIWRKEPIYKVNFVVDEMFGLEVVSQNSISEEKNYRAAEPAEPNKSTKQEHDNIQYSFKGWNTKADGTGKMWDFEEDEVTKDLTLYAQWETERLYTIQYFDGFSTENDYSYVSDYIYAVDGTKTPVSNFKGYYILDGEKQILGSEKIGALQPTFHRVDYTFDGWYLDNGVKYDNNRSIAGNGGDDVAVVNDKQYIINLTAKWSPVCKGSSSVEIATEELTQGTYKAYYSDFIDAYTANEAGIRVYRNYILTNKKGQVNGEVNALPQGLHLNKRTGEVYGVPVKAGNYSFCVRMADDEGNWISAVSEIKITVGKSPLKVFFADDAAVYDKVYGENDPAGLYHAGISRLKVETYTSDYVDTEYLHEAGNDNYKLNYIYNYHKNTHYADAFEENTAAVEGQLDKAPDLNDVNKTYVPSESGDSFKVTLKREKGEDAKVYKRFAEVVGAQKANYDVMLGGLENAGHADAQGKAYPKAYYFTIQKKAVQYTNDAGNRHYIYGELTGGSELAGGVFEMNYGLIRNKTYDRFDGYKVNDAEKVMISDQLDSKYLSNANRLKAGDYNRSTENAIQFVSTNTEYRDTNGANNATASKNTSDNYVADLSLSVYQKEIGLEQHALNLFTNTDVTGSRVKELASLTGVLENDIVDYTGADYIINGVTYMTEDKAAGALTKLATKAGDYIVKIHVAHLTGADAANYTIDSTVEVNIHVKNAVLLAYAKSSRTKNVTVTWNPIKGADHYIVYGAKCGSRMKTLAKVKATSGPAYTHKKLIKGKGYKYYVVALNGKKIVASSLPVYAIVGQKTGKYGDAKKITVDKKELVVSAGKTVKVNAKVNNYANKKSLPKKYAAKIRFKTADKSIARVSSDGKIRGVKTGKTRVYVQAMNGLWTYVKVTVK